MSIRNRIDHYAIVGKSQKDNSDGFWFVDGFKTLPTMRKKYYKLLSSFDDVSVRKRYNLMLVARDYDRNIIKIYEEDGNND